MVPELFSKFIPFTFALPLVVIRPELSTDVPTSNRIASACEVIFDASIVPSLFIV